MTAVPINAFQRRPKFNDISDTQAATLVRLIKMSSDQNGILIMKTLRNTIKKELTGRRKRPSFTKVGYQWLPRT